jgi:hypothetical protein
MGLLGGIAKTAIVAATAATVSNRVSRNQAGRWAEDDQANPQHAKNPNPYMPPPPGRYQRAMFQQHHYPPPPQPQSPPAPVYQTAPAYQPPAAAPPPESEMDARLRQLQQLAELKTQGILNDAEFQAEKNRILSN